MNYENTLEVLREMLEKDELIFSKRMAIQTAIEAVENMILMTE